MKFRKDYELEDGRTTLIREAGVSDCKATANIWNSVVKEKIFTMGLNFFSEDQEIEFLKSLDKRETILVAVLNGKIIGYSLVLIPEKQCKSTLHVGEIGTWILKEYRGLGIGHFLLDSILKLTKMNNFEKLIIKVRSSNEKALNFYKKLDFKEIGRFKRQIKINGKYDDHVLMEKFLI